MKNDSTLRGVGGWLALLVVGLTVLGPLRAIGQTLQTLQQIETDNPNILNVAAWANYKQWSWVLIAVIVSLSFAAGYRLWKVHHRDSVKFAIIVIWLIGPGGQFGDLLITWANFGNLVPISGEFMVGILSSSIGAAIWTAYLLRSRRVANTYSKTPEYVSA